MSDLELLQQMKEMHNKAKDTLLHELSVMYGPNPTQEQKLEFMFLAIASLAASVEMMNNNIIALVEKDEAFKDLL